MRSYFKNRVYLITAVIYSVFCAVIAGTTILRGDDILWKMPGSKSLIIGKESVNGRYLTNFITYYAVRYSLAQIAVAFIFVYLLFEFMLRVMDSDSKNAGYAAVFSAFGVFTMSEPIFSQTINWTSGLACYPVATVFLLGYLIYCKPLFSLKTPIYSKHGLAVPVITGFCGALCLENVTIYSIMLGVFIIVFSIKKFKKVFIGHILYFLGTIAGAAWMFTDHNYTFLFRQKEDDGGFRSIEMGFSDISHQIYEDLMGFYCIRFWILHIIICISFIFIYSSRYTGSDKKAPKYTLAALTVSVLYTTYAVYSNVFSSFAVWNVDLTIRALETAFTFFYIISIIYLGWSLCSRDGAVRFIFYIVSTAILSAPFGVVNPVNARCFFTDYIFWILAAGEVSMQAGFAERFKRLQPIRLFSTVIVGYLAFSICYISVWNKYTDVMRFDFIKEQLDSGRHTIEFIKLPYPEYQARDELLSYKESLDNMKESKVNTDLELEDTVLQISEYLFKEKGIEFDPSDYSIVIVSLYDHSLE